MGDGATAPRIAQCMAQERLGAFAVGVLEDLLRAAMLDNHAVFGEIHHVADLFGSHYVPFPDWVKVTIGLALPASANVAEIFRGAIGSIPSTQWEAARSLAFTRGQLFRSIILPQCFKRMLPPWMNLYAVVTMGTALASLVGVHDVIDTAQIASNTVNLTGFTVTIYLSLLVLFFAYCYPISRLTQHLERRYAFY